MSIKEENLIKYEGTILPGQRFAKVGNKLMPVGVGGAFEPGAGGGSSMKFYKCASVDTTAQTWTGYELLYNEAGYYELASDVTAGLEYSGMTPVVNYIYNADATLRIDRYYRNPDLLPTDGLVFYASLNGKTPDVAETGQTLTLVHANDQNYNWTYMVEDGIPCVSSADADGSDSREWSGLEFDASTLPMGSSPRTVSLWVKLYNSSNGGFFAYGNYSRGNTFMLYYASNYNAIKFSCHGDDVYSTTGYNLDTWRHIAVTLDGTTNKSLKFYVDGVQKETVVTEEIGINTSGSICRIGCGAMGGYGRFDGWLSSIRVYDRALSQEEITTLSQEFAPTTA